MSADFFYGFEILMVKGPEIEKPCDYGSIEAFSTPKYPLSIEDKEGLVKYATGINLNEVPVISYSVFGYEDLRWYYSNWTKHTITQIQSDKAIQYSHHLSNAVKMIVDGKEIWSDEIPEDKANELKDKIQYTDETRPLSYFYVTVYDLKTKTKKTYKIKEDDNCVTEKMTDYEFEHLDKVDDLDKTFPVQCIKIRN